LFFGTFHTMSSDIHYDLHSHSTLSDGTLSPDALVRRAHEQGVDVLALTDHDVTDGLAEAAATASEVGLRLVPGVEISVTWSGVTFHIIGLNIDPAHAGLQAGLSKLRSIRTARGEEIARRLEKSGIEGALAGAQAFASGPILSRTHFARFLVDAGHAKDMRKVFKKFLTHNRPGYVSGEAFKACGGEGIEVVSGSHSAGEAAGMAQYAKRYELLASCGSDYHGPEQSWQELGKPMTLPDGCVPIWTAWGNNAEMDRTQDSKLNVKDRT
jgi:predicted metal-dependent phosphoesterase TrpH